MNKIKSSLLFVGLVGLLATPIGFAQAGIEETIFKGCVLTVEDSPGIFAGKVMPFQIVTYEVKELLSGSSSSTITVHHLIIQDKSDVGLFVAELNPSIVFPGAALMVTVNPFPDDGGIGTINAAFQPVTPDSSIVCDGAPPPPVVPVGGKLISLDATSIFLAGAQSFSWMIPVIVSAIGIGIVIARKF